MNRTAVLAGFVAMIAAGFLSTQGEESFILGLVFAAIAGITMKIGLGSYGGKSLRASMVLILVGTLLGASLSLVQAAVS